MLSLINPASARGSRVYQCSYCFREERLPRRDSLRRPLCRRCQRLTQLGLEKIGAADMAKSAPPETAARPPDESRPRRFLAKSKTTLIGLIALAAVIAATRLLMTLYVSAASASSLALPAGSMTIASPETSEILRERALRIEAIDRYERLISRMKENPALQAPWLELKRRDLEELRLLEKLLPPQSQHVAQQRPRAFLDR